MSKSKRPEPSAKPARSLWLVGGLIALISGTAGATITWLALRPRLQPASLLAMPSAHPPTEVPAPDPELTAGLTPAEADRNLGNYYYDHRDWVRSARYYESAIRQGSDDADIRCDLGSTYQFSNRPTESLAQYHTAQRMNPQHELSLFNQGGLYAQGFNDPVKAIEAWNEYLRRFPEGEQAAAARELIAQTRRRLPEAGLAPAGGTTPAAAPAPAPAPDPTEARLMQLVTPPPAPGKP